MGFLDRIKVDGPFQTAKDGRMLYFPWPLGRGYIISSDAEFQRIQKKLKISLSAYIYLYLA